MAQFLSPIPTHYLSQATRQLCLSLPHLTCGSRTPPLGSDPVCPRPPVARSFQYLIIIIFHDFYSCYWWQCWWVFGNLGLHESLLPLLWEPRSPENKSSVIFISHKLIRYYHHGVGNCYHCHFHQHHCLWQWASPILISQHHHHHLIHYSNYKSSPEQWHSEFSSHNH